jgi:hypothetical protein
MLASALSENWFAKQMDNHVWFEKGKSALKQLYPETDFYVCPLCKRVFHECSFSDPDGLSVEHVPPEHYGGRRMVLTCRKCNNTAGAGIDAHLYRDEKLRNLGKPGGADAKLKIDDNENWAWVSFDYEKDPKEMVVLHGKGDPAANLLHDQMQRAGDGTMLRLQFTGGIRRHAYLSLLRAAYLVAFAEFGYLYVLREAFEPIRQMIQDPSSVDHEDFYAELPKEVESGRRFGFIRSPAWLVSLVVQFDRHLLFLPVFDDDDLYDRIREAKKQTQTTNLKMTVWDLPTEPTHRFDLDRALALTVIDSLARFRNRKPPEGNGETS